MGGLDWSASSSGGREDSRKKEKADFMEQMVVRLNGLLAKYQANSCIDLDEVENLCISSLSLMSACRHVVVFLR